MTSAETSKLGDLLEAVPDALVGMDGSGLIRFVSRQRLDGRRRDVTVRSWYPAAKRMSGYVSREIWRGQRRRAG